MVAETEPTTDTGLKVEDWLASAEDMSRQLQRLASDGAGEKASLKPPFAAYIAQLQRLAEYLAKQETDARGWFKDPEKLKMALEGLRYRRETSRKLAGLLERIRQE